MKLFPHLKHEDTQKLVMGTVSLVLVFILTSLVSQFVAVIATCLAAVVLISLFIMHYHREGIYHQNRFLENIQDLQFLQSQLPLRKPLPYLSGWSASPALGSRLHSLILDNKPSRILELGSGVSTVIMAYAVQQLGSGSVISLDHDAVYAEKTREELRRHHLDHLATVLHAPLIQTKIVGGHQPWYDLAGIHDLKSVDLLVVDGPPRKTAKDARLPAFEQLKDRLAPNCIVVIDDSSRSCESNSVSAWTGMANLSRNEDIPCEKGVSVRYLDQTRDAAPIRLN